MMDAGKRSFNLLDEPWIPVVGHGEKSVLDVFTDLSYRRLGGNPVEKVTITRLLLAIVHAAVPLPDAAAWRALTVEEIARKARDYLARWHGCFDLYDPQRPFLQFPRLQELKCKKVAMDGLSLMAACGNKTVLTQWHCPELSAAGVARLLLAGAAYGCGGKKYDKTCRLGGNVEKRSGAPGTLTGFAGYLHAMLVGDTIVDTLRLNLLSDNFLRALQLFPKSDPCGRPFWEEMPTDEDGPRAQAYRASYQGVLFPLDKFLLLEGDDVMLTSGIVYPGHKQGQWDPGVTIYADGKERKALWARTECHPWRQLPALLQFITDRASGRTSPAFLVDGFDQKLKAKPSGVLGVWAGGVEMSNNSGEQYVSGHSGFVDSEFSLPVEWIDDPDGAYKYFRIVMDEVDGCSRAVYGAVNKYHAEMGMDDKGSGALAARGSQLYWEKMEPLVESLLRLSVDLNAATDANEQKELLDKASMEWQRIGESCYADVCPHATPRQIPVYVRCRPRFGAAQPGAAKAKKDKRKKTSSEKKGDQ